MQPDIIKFRRPVVYSDLKLAIDNLPEHVKTEKQNCVIREVRYGSLEERKSEYVYVKESDLIHFNGLPVMDSVVAKHDYKVSLLK